MYGGSAFVDGDVMVVMVMDGAVACGKPRGMGMPMRCCQLSS